MKKITLHIVLIFIAQIAFSQETVVYYDDFQYDTNSGFTSFITYNPASVPVADLFSRNNTLPTETLLGYTRPMNNIPRGDLRAHKSLNVKGNSSTGNFEADIWFVTEAINISSLNNLVLSFASQNRFQEGPVKPVVKMLVTTGYDNGTDPTTVIWTDITSAITDVTETFYNDGLWAFSFVDLSSFISASGSDKFAVAVKAEYKNEGTFSSADNRNGNWFFSDFKFAENSTLSVSKILLGSDIMIYPNPTNNVLNVKTTENIKINNLSLIDVLGKTVYTGKNINQIDVRNFAQGIYILKITSEENKVLSKKIIID